MRQRDLAQGKALPALHERALSSPERISTPPFAGRTATSSSSDAFEALVRSRVAERAPTGVLFLAACFLLSGFFEVAYQRARLVPITLFAGGFTLLGVVAVALIRARPRWSVAVLLAVANLIGLGLSAYHVEVHGAAEGLALVETGLIATITVLYPWGWRRQAIAILGAVASFPVAIASGAVSTMPSRTLVAFLGVAAAMSLFGAEIVHSYLRSDFRLTSALREREARLQSYFDQALIGIAVIASNQAWREVNGELCRMLGYSRAELLGRSWEEITEPADRARERAPLAQIQSGESDAYTLDKRLRRKDGATLEAMVSVRCLRRADGQPDELVALVQDITDRKLTQAELERAREAAEAANLSKSDFLARMSHEIRTPMHIIFGMTEMALEGPLSREQRDYLARSQSAAKTLLVLINDILDLSKMEAGKLVLQRREFAVREWLHDILSPLTWLAGGKRLGLGIGVDEGVAPHAIGDPDRLAQVVVNLVSNAIKYTSEGRIDVLVHRGASPREIHIEIADTGIGIPVERQRAIFDAFVQGEPRSADGQEGTGLGLAICTRLVELMGGRIWVESQVGVGSRFHFTARVDVAQQHGTPA